MQSIFCTNNDINISYSRFHAFEYVCMQHLNILYSEKQTFLHNFANFMLNNTPLYKFREHVKYAQSPLNILFLEH